MLARCTSGEEGSRVWDWPMPCTTCKQGLRTPPRSPVSWSGVWGGGPRKRHREKISGWMWQNIPGGFGLYSRLLRGPWRAVTEEGWCRNLRSEGTTLWLFPEQTVFSHSRCLKSKNPHQILLSYCGHIVADSIVH